MRPLRFRRPMLAFVVRRLLQAILVMLAVAFVATVAWHSLIAAILVPVILFVGAIGAFIRTYQVWRDSGVWPIWHGAGWALLVLFLFCLNVPTAVG